MSEWQDISTAPKDGTECVQIQLTQGKMALVDAADVHLIANRCWQAQQRHDGKAWFAVGSDGTRMHRVILNAPNNKIVDHRNGDGLDNRRTNLRLGTQSLNCVNRRSTPGPFLRGAQRRGTRWRASIKLNGKMKSLGYFATEEKAHAAYLNAAHEAHGDWMPLPPPPKDAGT